MTDEDSQNREMMDATLRERVALVATGAAVGGAVAYFVMCLARQSSSRAKGKAAVRSTAASGVAPGGGAAVYESARAVQEYLAFHFLPAKVRARPHVPSSICWDGAELGACDGDARGGCDCGVLGANVGPALGDCDGAVLVEPSFSRVAWHGPNVERGTRGGVGAGADAVRMRAEGRAAIHAQVCRALQETCRCVHTAPPPLVSPVPQAHRVIAEGHRAYGLRWLTHRLPGPGGCVQQATEGPRWIWGVRWAGRRSSCHGTTTR